MPDSFLFFADFLRGYLGQRLISVEAEIYFFNGQFFKNTPLHLVLNVIEPVNYQRIGGASDGDTILIDNKKLKPVNMQESGEVMVCDISNLDPWNKVIKKMINKVFLVGNKENQRFIGLGFGFENGVSIYVMNWGDEIKFFTKLPSSFFREENVALIKIEK